MLFHAQSKRERTTAKCRRSNSLCGRHREQELVVAEEVDVYIDFDDVEEYNAWVRFADEQEILKDVYQNKNNERTVIVEEGTYSMMKEFDKKT